MADRLRLPSHFQDGMILQQQVPFHLYGWCKALADVQVCLERDPHDGRAVSPLDPQYGVLFSDTATADEQGAFALDIPARTASYDPYALTVTCGVQTVVLQDVLFGEVWIAGGQSNMQMPLSAIQTLQETETLAGVHYVRILSQSPTGLDCEHPHYSSSPAASLCGAKWLFGDRPHELTETSAVGFYFARQLHLDLKVPVGLVETALGGTHIHAWLRCSSIAEQDKIRRHVETLGFNRDLTDGDADSQSAAACHQPGVLFNSKVAPLHQLGARGVLWYQGESDYAYPEYYRAALQKLVVDWQNIFRSAGSKGLAFLLVQPAPFYYGHAHFTQLAEFNEMLAAVRHKLTCPSALLPLYDIPLDYAGAAASWRHPVHPVNKQLVGERLERMALGLLYQRKTPHTAPECSHIEIVGNKMILSFSQIGEGLRLAGQGERLRGFAICGPDRIFVAAESRILYGVRVMVWSDQVKQPQAVSYAFADMNQDANLISRAQLPVVPFRSDRRQSVHCPPLEWLHCDSLQVWCSPDPQDIKQTGWHPRWHISRGEGQLAVEPANKLDGDGSLHVQYRTDDQQACGLEPVLYYASLFPPLDLRVYDTISFSLFNPDQHMKFVRLALADGAEDASLQFLRQKSAVIAALRWQSFSYALAEVADLLDQVRRIVLVIEDKKRSGEIYLDRIRLIRPQMTGADHETE